MMKYALNSIFLFSSIVLISMEQPSSKMLFQAVSRGDLAKVKELAEGEGARIDVNVAAEDGTTPLHIAAQDGYLAIAHYLLCRGASINAATNLGVRPVHLAAQKGYIDLLRSLIQFPDKDNKLPDPNVRDNRGYTPLHYAAQMGHLDAIQYLHAWGAKIDSVADKDVMPISLAKAEGHDHVVHYLELTSITQNKPLRAKY